MKKASKSIGFIPWVASLCVARIEGLFSRELALNETKSPESHREANCQGEGEDAKKDGRDFPEKDRIARDQWRVFRMPCPNLLRIREIK